MMLKIIYLDNSYIQIKMFNTSAVQKWFEFFRQQNLNTNIYKSHIERKYPHLNFLPLKTFIKRTKNWKQIKKSLSDLKSLGYKLPYDFDNIDQVTINQNLLNNLHRFFTYNVMWYYEQHTSNPFDSEFSLPDSISFQHWHDLIDPINLAVHDIESRYVSTLNKKYVRKNYPLETFCFTNTRKNTDCWLEFNADDQLENFNFFNISNQSIVFLGDNILGKSVLQSFLDNDDPTAKDCTGRQGSHGCFSIDFKNNRKLLYRSDKFQNWIKKYNLSENQLPLEFAIGHVGYVSCSIKHLKNKARSLKEIKFLE